MITMTTMITAICVCARAALFDIAEKQFGRKPEIVLTTAGVIDEKNWQRCLDVNVVSRQRTFDLHCKLR